MTTNQDPLSHGAINYYYSQFEDKKNIEIIISLLKEYSDKLLKLCDNRDRYRNNIKLYFLGLILVPFFFMLISLIFFPESLFSYRYAINLIISLVLIFIGPGFIQAANQRLRLLERDLNIYANKLEKLIAITSQAHEHILNNLGTRLEVDFRLTDAESALEHYKNTKKNRLF